MKILGIAGSPREGGNTDLLLDEVLKGAKGKGAEVEKISLATLEFKGCIECGGCDKTGECILEDDLKPVYDKVKDADILILSSPVFFGSITAQLKMFMDRFQCWWISRYVLKKPVIKEKKKGIFFCVGGWKKAKFFEAAREIIKIFFAVLNIEYSGELFYGGVDEKDAIKKHPTALKEAFELGEKIVLANPKKANT